VICAADRSRRSRIESLFPRGPTGASGWYGRRSKSCGRCMSTTRWKSWAAVRQILGTLRHAYRHVEPFNHPMLAALDRDEDD